ncbi:uncharacterized protein (TIGR00369 family) [Cupriavidus gilardii J11]|uniref:Uncharacterized protein (TIGR00369 family) n=1 Tax=Cupriavidus gilardii J11 TaxID=936133 RepID=A0A562B533_9BURK|nr:PaaI family thioesterase [Cupriavidus gilardii]TWG80282.1 uncharacterized protein (TIGR00369 family) [Cupriavidus gilardii J11]
MTHQPNGFPIHIPFVELLGVRCIHVGGGISEIVMPVQAQHQNGWEMAHGGVLMTLLDVAMAIAGRSADSEGGRGVVTIEMKTSFMSPGRGTLTARGDCVHRTSSLAFCEAEIVDADGTLVARGSGTFKYIKRKQPQPDTGADG